MELKSSVRDLGAILDNHLTMSSHVSQVCKSASFSLRRLGQVRRYLDDATTEKLTHALITSKLDNCNSLLYGLPDTDLSKIQRIQNTAARLITRSRRQQHITPILRKLHWLPIKKRIIFKILLLTYKYLNGLAPEYLKSLLVPYNPTRNLRSGSKQLLRTDIAKTKSYGSRAFKIYAPKHWNDRPLAIRQSASLDI